jgi:hypothetical protein
VVVERVEGERVHRGLVVLCHAMPATSHQQQAAAAAATRLSTRPERRAKLEEVEGRVRTWTMRGRLSRSTAPGVARGTTHRVPGVAHGTAK